jgi:hypothetical protein
MTSMMLILISLALPPSPARAGGCSSSGCGGNFSATEFKDLAADAIADLRAAANGKPLQLVLRRTEGDEPQTVTLSVDPAVLEASFKSVSVVDGQLYLDGRVVDFKSDPKSAHVDFNGKDWEAHSSREERMRMVVHELLMLSTLKNPTLDDYLYNEQLSRKLTGIALGAEAKTSSVTAGKSFCQLITHKPYRFLDATSRRSLVQGVEDATAEEAKSTLSSDCRTVWGLDAPLCNHGDLRCETSGKKKFRARLKVVDSTAEGRTYAGYGNSAVEAEYRARKACLADWPNRTYLCGASKALGQFVDLGIDQPGWTPDAIDEGGSVVVPSAK